MTTLETLIVSLAAQVGVAILFKVTVVLGVAGVIATLLRGSSAARRHAVWAAAFAIAAALPLVTLAAPSWAWPVWEVVVPELRSPAVSPAVDVVTLGAGEGIGETAAGPAAQRGRALAPVVAAAGVGVWLAVCLLLLARLVAHRVHIARIAGRAVSGQRWLEERVERARRAMGVAVPVRALVSDELELPASWGVRRPTIILPREAQAWPAERTVAVVLHEMAHVARRDYALHLVAEFARALYWVNPLVWLAARRLTVERERACDDVALGVGFEAGKYAKHLVDIARLRFGGRDAAGTLAMARESGLAERVRGILNPGAPRWPLQPRGFAAVAVVALWIGVPIATFDLLQLRQVPTVDDLTRQLNDRDGPVARRAAWRLGELEDPRGVSALIDRLQNGPADVALVAAWALGEIKDARALAALSAAVTHEDPFVREMATLALGEIEHPGAVAPLMTVFDNDESLRTAVVWALGEIDSEDAVDAQRLAAGRIDASTEHEEVWNGTLHPDDQREPVRDLTALMGELGSRNAATRRTAAMHLGMLDDIAAVDALLAALRDPDPSVRAMAVWALDEINPSRPGESR